MQSLWEECTSRESELFPQSKLPEDTMKKILIKLKLDLGHVAKLKQFMTFVMHTLHSYIQSHMTPFYIPLEYVLYSKKLH